MRFFNGLAAGAAVLGLSLAAGGAAKAEKLAAWGAELGANKDGSITAWEGEKGLNGKVTYRNNKMVDPFPGEKPLFTITRANMGKYQANLSPGQIEMLKRYGSYQIPVYKTKRIQQLPSDEIQNIKAEQGKVGLAGDTGLRGLDKTHVPFPQPKSGIEAIWNHVTRYRAGRVSRNYHQIPVQQNGNYTAQHLTDYIIFRKSLEKNADNANMLIKFLQVFRAPAQLQGNVLLVYEYIDQVKQPRAAWLYNPGQRRVRRAPNVAYDGPANGSEGLRTTDDFDMFNGSPNKFSWKYLGKREMYVPANAFRIATAPTLDAIMGKNNMNPQYTRYEKRRVHVVEAKLKGSERHIYSRRVFYLDEDGWNARLKENYDSRGNLWRHGEQHSCYFSGHGAMFTCAEPLYDFQAGRWLMLGSVTGNDVQFIQNDPKVKESMFTTGNLRRLGR